MAVDFIGGASSAMQTGSLQSAALGQEQFLKILLTQLRFQDPLKPLDNQEFLAQMAQFSSLAQTLQMNDRIDTLLSIQSSTQSIGLLGKTVEVSASGASQAGQVTSLVFLDGIPTLTVMTPDGAFLTGVRLSQISLVR